MIKVRKSLKDIVLEKILLLRKKKVAFSGSIVLDYKKETAECLPFNEDFNYWTNALPWSLVAKQSLQGLGKAARLVHFFATYFRPC